MVALDNSTDVTLPATYTGVSGNQTRGASTLDDSDWTIGDQGGIYTNGSTTPSPSGNYRSVKDFGGTTYVFTASASSPPVGTLASPSGSTFTALPGLPDGSTNAQDFYLIQSGSNGSTFDVLYVLSASSATAGTIAKYSLVNGSWTANGSYTTSFGGFGLAAANDGSGGAYLYVTTGTGSTTANQVIQLTDTAGYDTSINITTANNVTLYTAPAGTLLKGIAFAPVANTATTTAVTNVSPLTASNTQSITLTATVTATSVVRSGFGYRRVHQWRCQRHGAGHSHLADHQRHHCDLQHYHPGTGRHVQRYPGLLYRQCGLGFQQQCFPRLRLDSRCRRCYHDRPYFHQSDQLGRWTADQLHGHGVRELRIPAPTAGSVQFFDGSTRHPAGHGDLGNGQRNHGHLYRDHQLHRGGYLQRYPGFLHRRHRLRRQQLVGLWHRAGPQARRESSPSGHSPFWPVRRTTARHPLTDPVPPSAWE